MPRLLSLRVSRSGLCAAVMGCWLLLTGTGCAHTVPLTVMTFNIRYGTADDGLNSWKHRRPMVVDVIKKHDPDVMGLQEVLAFQRDELLAALPGYECVGVGRDDGKEKGEFAPILFKRDRFELVDKGWFWLSETPDKPGSIGWDAACPRIATWVQLRSKVNQNGDIHLLNTHLDHKGRTARGNAGTLLQRWASQRTGLPTLIVGDFNCSATDPVHQDLIRRLQQSGVGCGFSRPPPGLISAGGDAYTDTRNDEMDVGTFNSFEGVHTSDRIDWILHSPEIKATACEIDRISYNGRYPSDHFPVVAKLNVSTQVVRKAKKQPEQRP